MAFQGAAPTVRTAGPAGVGNYKNFVRMEFPAAALLANTGAGAFNVANADSGRVTSNSAIVANTNYIGGGAAGAPVVNAVAARFGRGVGNWVANDEYTIEVRVEDQNVALQGGLGQTSLIDVVAKRVNAGQLELDIFNRGSQVSGAFAINIWWHHTAGL